VYLCTCRRGIARWSARPDGRFSGPRKLLGKMGRWRRPPLTAAEPGGFPRRRFDAARVVRPSACLSKGRFAGDVGRPQPKGRSQPAAGVTQPRRPALVSGGVGVPTNGAAYLPAPVPSLGPVTLGRPAPSPPDVRVGPERIEVDGPERGPASCCSSRACPGRRGPRGTAPASALVDVELSPLFDRQPIRSPTRARAGENLPVWCRFVAGDVLGWTTVVGRPYRGRSLARLPWPRLSRPQ